MQINQITPFNFTKQINKLNQRKETKNISFQGQYQAVDEAEHTVRNITNEANFISRTVAHYITQQSASLKVVARANYEIINDLIEQGKETNFQDILYKNAQPQVKFIVNDENTMPEMIFEYDINGSLVRTSLIKDDSRQITIFGSGYKDIYEYDENGAITNIAKGCQKGISSLTIEENYNFENNSKLSKYTLNYFRNNFGIEKTDRQVTLNKDGTINTYSINTLTDTDGSTSTQERFVWKNHSLAYFEKDIQETGSGDISCGQKYSFQKQTACFS